MRNPKTVISIRQDQWASCMLLVSLLMVFVASSNAQAQQQPCEHPLTFRVGTIDSRYMLSRDQVAQQIKKASRIWKDALGHEVARYDPEGNIPIHLIYTKEQRNTQEREEFENHIESERKVIASLEAAYDSLHQIYKKWLYEYEDRHRRLNRLMTDYNETVKFINAGGGGTNNYEAEDLKQLKKRIKEERRSLQQFSVRVDSMRYAVNDLGNEINWLATDNNVKVKEYNKRYGSPKTFYQGKYYYSADERKIEIYQYANLQDLGLVIAHEIGHALGLNHVTDPDAIMYYLKDSAKREDFSLSPSDKKALQALCSGS
jgi:hypothetical protein